MTCYSKRGGTPEQAAADAWAEDPMGEIRKSVREMRARLEAGHGAREAMCRLSPKMTEWLLLELEQTERLCIALYLAHGRRLGPDEEARIAATRRKHRDRSQTQNAPSR